MTRCLLTPRARQDIDEIWDYSAERWGDGQAEAYFRQIQAGIERIADDPRKGRSCEAIRAGYFKYKVGSHVLFYRVSDRGATIVRVLHERMDFSRHLG